MRQTPSKMRMNDMVTIDTIVFDIVGGGAFKDPPPPPESLTFSNITDQIGLSCYITFAAELHVIHPTPVQ